MEWSIKVKNFRKYSAEIKDTKTSVQNKKIVFEIQELLRQSRIGVQDRRQIRNLSVKKQVEGLQLEKDEENRDCQEDRRKFQKI